MTAAAPALASVLALLLLLLLDVPPWTELSLLLLLLVLLRPLRLLLVVLLGGAAGPLLVPEPVRGSALPVCPTFSSTRPLEPPALLLPLLLLLSELTYCKDDAGLWKSLSSASAGSSSHTYTLLVDVCSLLRPLANSLPTALPAVIMLVPVLPVVLALLL